MEAKLPEIVLAESICEKIKNVYFPNKSWVQCYQDVARGFTELKRIARQFYTDKTDKEILTELTRYGTDDIREAYALRDTKSLEFNAYAIDKLEKDTQGTNAEREKEHKIDCSD